MRISIDIFSGSLYVCRSKRKTLRNINTRKIREQRNIEKIFFLPNTVFKNVGMLLERQLSVEKAFYA